MRERGGAMLEDGAVSLWVGHSASAESLEEAMNVAYSADGDVLGSAFGNGFGLGSYDDDFREAVCLESSSATLTDALEGCSYSTRITPAFVALAGNTFRATDNSVVLLYNYRFEGGVSSWEGSGVTLRFIGSVRYR